jgi:UDP-glucose 4-epimerase
MRILLTGGAGFIGSHVADCLLEGGHEVAIMDDLSSGKPENIRETAHFYKADVRTGCLRVFEEFAPEVLCHQAAQMDVRRYMCEPNFDAEGQQRGVGHPPRLREVRRARLSGQSSSPPRGGIYGKPRSFWQVSGRNDTGYEERVALDAHYVRNWSV